MDSNRIFILLSRKLAGEATTLELAELDDLIEKYPYNKLPLEVIEEYWGIACEKDRDFLEATYHLHLDRLKKHGFDLTETQADIYATDINPHLPAINFKQRPFKKLIAIGSFLLISVSLFFMFIANKKKLLTDSNAIVGKLNQSEVSTKNGSRTKIQLPDGTSVWLNGSSKLVYNNEQYGKSIREVTLTGEGYFDVIKNPEKPFIIHTSKMDIKVLGTVFNVRCYPGEKNTETSLLRGSIEVTLRSRREKIMLKPSEKLIVSDDIVAVPEKVQDADKPVAIVSHDQIIVLRHLTVLPKDSTIVETAWVENRLVFSSELFEDVALKMEKWYGVQIQFSNEKLKKELLTATFRKETIAEALRALQLTTRFNYKIDKDTITISK